MEAFALAIDLGYKYMKISMHSKIRLVQGTQASMIPSCGIPQRCCILDVAVCTCSCMTALNIHSSGRKRCYLPDQLPLFIPFPTRSGKHATKKSNASQIPVQHLVPWAFHKQDLCLQNDLEAHDCLESLPTGVQLPVNLSLQVVWHERKFPTIKRPITNANTIVDQQVQWKIIPAVADVVFKLCEEKWMLY